jgi:hypothetical protein
MIKTGNALTPITIRPDKGTWRRYIISSANRKFSIAVIRARQIGRQENFESSLIGLNHYETIPDVAQ